MPITTSITRLSNSEDFGQPVLTHAEQRDPVDLVERRRGADDLQEPRQHAHLDAERLDETDRVERSRPGRGCRAR